LVNQISMIKYFCSSANIGRKQTAQDMW